LASPARAENAEFDANWANADGLLAMAEKAELLLASAAIAWLFEASLEKAEALAAMAAKASAEVCIAKSHRLKVAKRSKAKA